MKDRNGHWIEPTIDHFLFDPPYYPNETDYYADLRGRRVQIREVITQGNVPTVSLKSADPVMAAELRQGRTLKVGCYYPVSWLRLID